MNAARLGRLVECQAFVVLVPVRGKGTATHYARRDSKFGPEAGPSLCGAMGALDRYARPRWRRARTAERICQACHAKANAISSRVDWS
jgi:hypothetical protein